MNNHITPRPSIMEAAHPAAGKPSKATGTTRRKTRKLPGTNSMSPDSFLVRGGSRKNSPWRRNPAP